MTHCLVLSFLDVFGTGICGSRPAYLPKRVFGGGNAEIGNWPWIGSIQVYGDHGCGCTLITPEWAVTAAHCVYVIILHIMLCRPK